MIEASMNLILLTLHDLVDQHPNRVKLTGRRLQHIRTVHRAVVGDTLTVGMLNGDIGVGTIKAIDNDTVVLDITLNTPPPKPLPLTLFLALPRPIMLKRILQSITAMGVKQLYLINTNRVEKSYWQTPLLEPDALFEQLCLGLEQAKDTALPEIHLIKRFKPFVEDQLSNLIANKTALIAHPGLYPPCPYNLQSPVCLAIGPEGGFIDYEVQMLIESGFSPVHIGARILRVETAVPVLIGKLF